MDAFGKNALPTEGKGMLKILFGLLKFLRTKMNHTAHGVTENSIQENIAHTFSRNKWPYFFYCT